MFEGMFVYQWIRRDVEELGGRRSFLYWQTFLLVLVSMRQQCFEHYRCITAKVPHVCCFPLSQG